MRFKVEMLFSYGWDDAPWSIDGKLANVFDSESQAQDEVNDLIQETEFALKSGNMDEQLKPSDFRIVSTA